MRIYLVLIVLAVFMIGCGGSDKTELQWENQSASSVHDIKWQRNASSPHDQIWEDETRVDITTDLKEVNVLQGMGMASVDDGVSLTEAPIMLDTTEIATRLNEGDAQKLVIGDVMTAKRVRELGVDLDALLNVPEELITTRAAIIVERE